MANPQDIQKIKEFFSKPLEETSFKKGDKVTYLGHPGEITGVNKEMTGAITYNVAYDKGNGRTKVTNLSNKGGEIKSLKEVISTPMDAVEFLNSNKDEIIKLADQFKGDPVSMQKAIDIFLAPHIEGASNFIVDRLKAAIGSAIAKRNIAADPKLSAAYDTLKNVRGVVKEEYTVAGRPVTLNKGKKSNGTDWTVTFLSDSSIGKKGEEIPLSDVLALIKPFPKGITMNEAKKETAVDMAKKQLDALGVKYELSGNEFRPFKAIYKPINKPDRWYDEFEDIIHLFNLGSVVKQSMSEAKSNPEVDKLLKIMNTKKTGSEYKKALMDLIAMAEEKSGKTINTKKEALLALDYVEPTIREAKSEDKVDTITMDIPLFLRMLEYSREDASQDMDLHDVTDKAISLGKERGILSMEDYEEIIGAAKEIGESKKLNEGLKDELIDLLTSKYGLKFQLATGIGALIVNLAQRPEMVSKLLSMIGLNENQEELAEAYVPSNIAEFAKRKGISPLVKKVAGWAEKVGARIAGGTAIGKNYSTLVLDLDYKQQGEIRIDTDEETIELYDEPVSNFNQFQRVYMYGPNWERKDLEEGKEEQLSFISKARAKSSLRQFLSGKRDDGMGKFDAIVYGIDADGNKHQIKSYNDLQNYEEFALGDNPDFVKEGLRGELDEPFFIEVSVRDARKALDLFQDRYRNSNIDMYGSNVYAANTPEDIYDLYYDLMSQDIEVLDYNVEDEDFDYDSEYEKTLRETIKFIKESNPEATTEEIIAELKEIKALGQQLNEELCPAGKAYIKRRQAAGEKSSAYLSGRAVKVCKGQMSGRKKKK